MSLRLKNGRAVEWEIHRKFDDGTHDVWYCGYSEAATRRAFRDVYGSGNRNGEEYVLIKLTYESVQLSVGGKTKSKAQKKKPIQSTKGR